MVLSWVRRNLPFLQLIVGILSAVSGFLGGLQLTLVVFPPTAEATTRVAPTPEPKPTLKPLEPEWHEIDLGYIDFEYGKLLALGRGYSWAYGSSTMLQRDSSEVEAADTLDHHFSFPGLRQRLVVATDIVAVGMASEEGSDSDNLEVSRNRARELGLIVNRFGHDIARAHKIWLLHMGRFSGRDNVHCGALTSHRTDQRSVLLIAIKRAAATELTEHKLRTALRRAMASSDAAFKFDPSCYSVFELEPWSPL